MITKTIYIVKRLEYLREQLRNETISYEELVELHSLKHLIAEDDVELREAAGIPEFSEEPLTPIV